MKKFKYINIFQNNERNIWTCAACKKAHIEKILLGEWKLIEMSDDPDIQCDICGAALKKQSCETGVLYEKRV
jgi:predicted nucleic acid-binding Zn ribbon protein